MFQQVLEGKTSELFFTPDSLATQHIWSLIEMACRKRRTSLPAEPTQPIYTLNKGAIAKNRNRAATAQAARSEII
jgi:hypothetical protein